MRRRDFIRVVAGGVALAAPVSARSQQPTKPVIGYLSVQAIAGRRRYIEAFRSGLASEGFIEGQNLTIEYRADGRPERLSELAAASRGRRDSHLGRASGSPPNTATETIPIVFASGGDPVQLGFVSSFSRPDKNLTGIYFQLAELVAKRLALLRELLPGATRVA
ncbi:MAG: ABC transporter substrate binding protein [Pseudolabrys sp.]